MFVATAERTGFRIVSHISWSSRLNLARPVSASCGDKNGLGRHYRIYSDFPYVFAIHGIFLYSGQFTRLSISSRAHILIQCHLYPDVKLPLPKGKNIRLLAWVGKSA